MKLKYNSGDRIIAPQHLHNYLYRNLLDDNTPAIFGLFIESWEVYSRKDTEFIPEELEEICQIQHKLHDNIDKFHTLQQMISYPSFINEIHTFRKDMIYYNININDLPEENDTEKEIKLIMTLIENIPLLAEIQVQNFMDIDVNKTQIISQFLPSIFHNRLLEDWKTKGIRTIDIPKIDKPDYKLYKALNRRQEFESIAQHIIENEIDISKLQIVLTNSEDTLVLQQVFSRYEIPLDLSVFSTSSIIISKLVSLLEFIDNPTLNNLSLALSKNCWQFDSNHLVQYLEYFDLNPVDCLSKFCHVQDIDINIVDKRDIQKLVNLEVKANSQREIIVDLLEVLLSNTNYKNKVIAVFDFLREDNIINYNHEETKCLTKAKAKLEVLLNNNSDIQTIIYHISKINKPLTGNNGLLVTKSNKLGLDKELTIICNLTQSNFPTPPSKDGVISETYLAKITNYPTLEQRVNFYFEQLETLYHISSEIIFSYSNSNLSGKPQLLSLEIEKIVGKNANSWPLYQDKYYHNISHTLDIDIANKLFIKDGYINGSISSFESYINSPYTYFLERGCGVYSPELFKLSAMTLGTIQHDVIRTIIKDNIDCDKDKVDSLISPHFEQLSTLLPKQTNRINFIKKQLINNMLERISYTEEMIGDSLFIPFMFEQPVNEVIDIKPTPIRFRGVIDRIDKFDSYFRIIDYKSSSKELKEQEFKNGKELQLLTYAMITENIYSLTPFGVYYLPLRLDNTSCPAYIKFDKELGYVHVNEVHKENMFYSNNRASGVLIDDSTDERLVQEKYFKYPKWKDLIDWKDIKVTLLDIYSDISNRITYGEIGEDGVIVTAFSSLNQEYNSKSTAEINREVENDEMD